MLSHQEIFIRLAVATLLGGLIGLERERLEWAAGLRTHMLVCVGATLLMLVSAFGFGDVQDAPHVSFDPSRVAAQVVSGIGFLGAGTILFLRQRVIRGLTTAASLWAVAAIGLAVGGGLYFAAITTTVIVLATLALLKPIERRLFNRHPTREIVVLAELQQVSLHQLETLLLESRLTIAHVTIARRAKGNADRVSFTLDRSGDRNGVLNAAERLRLLDGVREVML